MTNDSDEQPRAEPTEAQVLYLAAKDQYVAFLDRHYPPMTHQAFFNGVQIGAIITVLTGITDGRFRDDFFRECTRALADQQRVMEEQDRKKPKLILPGD